jgi:hypothetical protein
MPALLRGPSWHLKPEGWAAVEEALDAANHEPVREDEDTRCNFVQDQIIGMPVRAITPDAYHNYLESIRS